MGVALSDQRGASKGRIVRAWSFIFFGFAAISALFGFAGIAQATAGIAVLLFWVFVILGLAAAAWGYATRDRK